MPITPAEPAESGTPSHSEIAAIHARLDEGDERMARFEDSLKDNTEATQRIEANTGVLVEVFNSWQGAMKVLTWIGKLAKPLGAIVGLGVALAAAWTAFRSGAPLK